MASFTFGELLSFADLAREGVLIVKGFWLVTALLGFLAEGFMTAPEVEDAAE